MTSHAAAVRPAGGWLRLRAWIAEVRSSRGHHASVSAALRDYAREPLDQVVAGRVVREDGVAADSVLSVAIGLPRLAPRHNNG